MSKVGSAHEADTPTSPFAVGLFRRLWLSTLVTAFGINIQGVGAAWLMTDLSKSPSMVALVQTSMVLPIMLFALLAGAIADGFERRTVMVSSQVFMMVVSVGLVACATMGLLTPAILLMFTFAVGCGQAFNAPASQALLGEIVPRSALPGAVAYSSMTYNIARTVGPAIGGAIVGAFGSAGAFIVNAAGYVPLVAVLLHWRPPVLARDLPRERVWSALAAGIHYSRMSPHMARVIPRAALFGTAVAAVSGLLPIIARQHLHGGPLIYGMLLGAYGVGSVAASLIVRPLFTRWGSETVVTVASLVTAVGTVVLPLSPYVALSMVALLGVGIGWVLVLSTCNTVIQLATPRWVVARALSLFQMAAYGAMAIGAAGFGVVAARYGLTVALFGSASLHIVSCLIGRFVPIVDEEHDLEPGPWTAPSVAVPIEGRSGPIVISIVYEIAEADILKFLALMAERKRVRKRDGAHGWTLMRALGNPLQWVERYDVATWNDYIRHNQRRTVADNRNWDAIRALHRGDKGPHVSRLIERQTGNIPAGRSPSARDMTDLSQS